MATGVAPRLRILLSRSLRARPAVKLKGGKTVKVEGAKTVTRSCLFGLRLGLDLVVAVVVFCVLFMALEPGAKGAWQ